VSFLCCGRRAGQRGAGREGGYRENRTTDDGRAQRKNLHFTCIALPARRGRGRKGGKRGRGEKNNRIYILHIRSNLNFRRRAAETGREKKKKKRKGKEGTFYGEKELGRLNLPFQDPRSRNPQKQEEEEGREKKGEETAAGKETLLHHEPSRSGIKEEDRGEKKKKRGGGIGRGALANTQGRRSPLFPNIHPFLVENISKKKKKKKGKERKGPHIGPKISAFISGWEKRREEKRWRHGWETIPIS